MNQGQKWQGVREGLATVRTTDGSMGRHNVSEEKQHNWFTASISLTATNLGGIFLQCRAEPPCTPLSGDEWYDRVIFRAEEHYHAVSPFVQRSERDRERDREGRETAESLWDSSTALRQVHWQTPHTSPQNPTLSLYTVSQSPTSS